MYPFVAPSYLAGWASLLGHANSLDSFSAVNKYILPEYCVFFLSAALVAAESGPDLKGHVS
ncbi:hypothetical protein EGR_09431 [Echinococcus granulosus]|uniref:Uncharacterized protein n=1 Tax=Echinococcus granulosus TaxID=6210 RepID=W6U3N9_ECHGR|nr:hypothetical protein EGR_09431 [Echinococcus granulosus]EUB55718.1 hypothetical protein EGR_09431 [Echinococcus granulosus]